MKTIIKKLVPVLGVVVSTVMFNNAASGQSADALIDKLIDKGILTVKEGDELREQADKDFTRAYSVKSGMPEWVTALKFNGDVRLRYEGLYLPDDQAAPGALLGFDRHRFRYRLRFGATASLLENLEVGFRLTSSEASGAFGGDPISGNTSFNNNGSKKFIYLDQVYGKWTPLNNPDWGLTLTGGKMANPFAYSDLVFDGDYTPEGFAFDLKRNLNDKHALSLIGGGFVIMESQVLKRDASYFSGQLRLESLWNVNWQSSFGVGLLGLSSKENLNTALLPNSNTGNTRDGLLNLVYNYNPIVVDAAITHTLEKFPYYQAAFPIKVFGEYMHNPAAPGDNYGWSAGVQFGKSGKRGLWDVSYRYKYLGADAWYEEFVDSDFGGFYGATPVGGASAYRSGTNVRGHVIKLQYSPAQSMTVAVTYIMTDLINDFPSAAAASGDSDAGRLQVDVSWKF